MEFEQQLRAALAPCSPGSAVRAAVMARVSSAQRQKSRLGRPVVYGTIVVVAAAAAMLAAYLMDRPSIEPVAVIVAREQGPGIADAAAEPVPVESTALESLREVSAPEETLAVKPFTVSIQLKNDAQGVATPAVESFYITLLENLRSVPGLVLMDQKSDSTASAPLADYRLLVTGSGPVGNRFSAMIMQNPMDIPGMGLVGKTGFGAGSEMANPAALAATMMEYLRSKVLPADPAYRKRLQARLLDAGQDPQKRLKALTDLGSIGRASPGGMASLDSVTLRGAIDLANSIADPKQRAEIWRALRGAGNAELVPALVASLREDSSMEVRLEALATLNADFRDEAQTRSTLESMAREDARPLMRALAQRALTGDVAWKQYIVSSLQDTSRPAAERLEAFAYQMYGITPGSTGNRSTGDPKYLSEEMLQSLSLVLPQASGTYASASFTYNLAGNLLSNGSPTAIRIVLGMAKQSADPADRTYFTNQLGQSATNGLRSSSVRATLEKVSTDDPDAQLRQIAVDALKSAGPVEANLSAGLATALAIVKQNPDPNLTATMTSQLRQRSSDPRVRAELERISASDPDPAIRNLATDLLK